jgi:hypothetical protein
VRVTHATGGSQLHRQRMEIRFTRTTNQLHVTQTRVRARHSDTGMCVKGVCSAHLLAVAERYHRCQIAAAWHILAPYAR